MKVYCRNQGDEGPGWIWKEFSAEQQYEIWVEEGSLIIVHYIDGLEELTHIFAPDEWKQVSRV